jgi:hypothetical protein
MEDVGFILVLDPAMDALLSFDLADILKKCISVPLTPVDLKGRSMSL